MQHMNMTLLLVTPLFCEYLTMEFRICPQGSVIVPFTDKSGKQLIRFGSRLTCQYIS